MQLTLSCGRYVFFVFFFSGFRPLSAAIVCQVRARVSGSYLVLVLELCIFSIVDENAQTLGDGCPHEVLNLGCVAAVSLNCDRVHGIGSSCF